MTISEMIERLQELAETHGEDAEVLAAYQESYPLAGVVDGIADPDELEDEDDEGDDDEDAPCAREAEHNYGDRGPHVWLCVGGHPRAGSPYGPSKSAWSVAS